MGCRLLQPITVFSAAEESISTELFSVFIGDLGRTMELSLNLSTSKLYWLCTTRLSICFPSRSLKANQNISKPITIAQSLQGPNNTAAWWYPNIPLFVGVLLHQVCTHTFLKSDLGIKWEIKSKYAFMDEAASEASTVLVWLHSAWLY